MELSERVARFSDIYSSALPDELEPRIERFNEASGRLEERLGCLFEQSAAAQKAAHSFKETLSSLDTVFKTVTGNILNDDPGVGKLYEQGAKPLVAAFWKELDGMPRATSYPTYEHLREVATALYMRVNAAEAIWAGVNPQWAGRAWFHDVLSRSLVPSNRVGQFPPEPDQFVYLTYDLLAAFEDPYHMRWGVSAQDREVLGQLEARLVQLAEIVHAEGFEAEAFSATRDGLKELLSDAKKRLPSYINTRLSQRIEIAQNHWKERMPQIAPLLTTLYNTPAASPNVNRKATSPPPASPNRSRSLSGGISIRPAKDGVRNLLKRSGSAVKSTTSAIKTGIGEMAEALTPSSSPPPPLEIKRHDDGPDETASSPATVKPKPFRPFAADPATPKDSPVLRKGSSSSLKMSVTAKPSRTQPAQTAKDSQAAAPRAVRPNRAESMPPPRRKVGQLIAHYDGLGEKP